MTTSNEDDDNSKNGSSPITMNNLIILINMYVNMLPKLTMMRIIHLSDNERVSDLLNDVIYMVGKHYH